MTAELAPDFPDSKVRSYLPITNPVLVESFIDPIRRAILVALRYGTESVKEYVTTEEIVRDDGTRIRTTTVEEKKTKRFWMTVPEIVSNVEQYLPEIEVSKYNCYYHLPKLVEQGLVEEFSPKEDSDSKSKRGVYYRRTAKVFVLVDSKMSGDVVDTYVKLFKEGLDIKLSDRSEGRLRNLLMKQVEMIDKTMEYLAMHLKEVDVESTTLSDLLLGLSYIFLSDNQEFLEMQHEIKKTVLTPCCGPSTDMQRICTYCGDPLESESMILRSIDGATESFCSDECADDFVKSS